MKVSDLKPKPPKIILYGPAGTGKTPLALTLGARAQILDLDDGLKSAFSIQDKWRADRLSVDVQQFLEPDPTKFAKAFDQCKKHIYNISALIRQGKYPFQALIIDSLTTLADAAVNHVMANSSQLGQAPKIQHWGGAFTEIGNVMGVVRSMPIVVVLIAHDQLQSLEVETVETRDGESRAVIKQNNKVEIAIPGRNLPAKITRYFDEILYMKVRQGAGGKQKRILQSVSDGLVTARSRSGLVDGTDADLGMWEILSQMGYSPEPEEVKK